MNDSLLTTALLILARAPQYGSGMALVAVMTFRWLIASPAFVSESDDAWAKAGTFLRRLRSICLVAGTILVLSGCLHFWCSAVSMSGESLSEVLDDGTLSTVFRQTQFGQVSEIRLVLAFLLLLGAWPLHRHWLRRGNVLLDIIGSLVATGLLVSIAWTGHAAAANEGREPWALVADAAHLFAASLWPGGLLPFALFVHHTCRRPDDFPAGGAIQVVRRFSAMSFLVVGVLATTGTINAVCLVGSFDTLLHSDYGHLLCLKVALFILILSIAAWNRYLIVPKLALPSGEDHLPLFQQLRVTVLAELALATAVIVVVAVLGIMPP